MMSTNPGSGAPGTPGTTDVRSRIHAMLWSLSIEVALRAALAVAVPLIALLAIGRLDLAPYATFGAFTAIYGSNEPYPHRARSVSVAALGFVTCTGLGILVAVLGAPLPLLVPLLLLVVAGGIVIGAVFRLLPAQPVFQTFALLVCAILPTPATDAWPRLAICTVVAVFSWLLTMCGWVIRRLAPKARSEGRIRPILLKELYRRTEIDAGAIRDPRVWQTVGENLVGLLLAGAIAITLGLGHAYWAVLTVVAVMPPPRARHAISRAVHRVVGTAVGVVVTGLLLFWAPPFEVVVAAVIVCQGVTQLLVMRHYGAALVFMTPVALSMSYLAASPTPLSTLLFDRVLDTVIGAVVAILLMLLARWLARVTARR
jgi:uncharacterized membrane protein YccC